MSRGSRERGPAAAQRPARRLGPSWAVRYWDFFPDDPAAALDLSDGLVSDPYTWEGSAPAQRLADELGPSRTVTCKSLANGGSAAITSGIVRPSRPRASPR
ncbi:hypothetical protein AB0N07_36645 [Streptomyces sp. NPDC051172]|uniref:hypothetical protein n=1 Tax=Streptomyces sp. NPDC051172 TaxID=3155796 RepID=UPI00342E43D5